MKKRYKVIGTAPILNHQPGEIFEADLDPGEAAFFFEIGAIELVKQVEHEIRDLKIRSHKRAQ